MYFVLQTKFLNLNRESLISFLRQEKLQLFDETSSLHIPRISNSRRSIKIFIANLAGCWALWLNRIRAQLHGLNAQGDIPSESCKPKHALVLCHTLMKRSLFRSGHVLLLCLVGNDAGCRTLRKGVIGCCEVAESEDERNVLFQMAGISWAADIWVLRQSLKSCEKRVKYHYI